MGGKGGGGSDYGQMAYNNAFDAAQRGASYGSVESMFTGPNAQFGEYGLAGFQAGGGQMPGAGGIHAGKPYDFFADAMKGMHAPSGGGVDFEAQMQAQQDMLAQQEAERQRIEGENSRDALYGQYMDAAGSATDYINQQIANEQANARLLGIDYQIDDEMKGTRISDYFASIWGEGQQQQLEALMGEWGKPAGFGGFTITRGDAGNIKGEPGGEESVGAGQGQRPTIVDPAAEEEDVLGGAATVLGG